ncbi:MAG: glycosyltransferase family 2 protein [Parcubacteria group bacterium]|nr:glycosyltransferase family 2 protein [Parcubacteria group bacterium]
MVSAIIPAYNEEQTVGAVLFALKEHPLIGEVIVVDDGSTDRTALLAEQSGARVLCIRKRCGKAEAMEAGVRESRFPALLFLDADIVGLTPDMVTRIASPVLSGRYEMFVALRGRKMFFLNKLLRFFPILGGERALTKRLWYTVPEKFKHRFQIEIALNYYAKKTRKKMGFALFRGLHNTIKEEKYGVVRGFFMRVGMCADVVWVSFRLYVLERFFGNGRGSKNLFRISCPVETLEFSDENRKS